MGAILERLDESERGIIKRFQEDIPVRVVDLCNEMGIRVFTAALPGAAGQIIKEDDGKYKISVKESDSYPRQRFTIAHELAHFLLHKEDIGDGIADSPLYRSSSLSNQQEVEANKLAAHILMPMDTVNKIIGERRVDTLEELAGIFAVSPSAMRVRLGIPN